MFWKTWVPKLHLLNMCGRVARLNQYCEYWLVLHLLEDENIVAKQEYKCSVYIVASDVLYFFLAWLEKPHVIGCVVAFLLDCIWFEICNDAVFKCMMPFFVMIKKGKKSQNDLLFRILRCNNKHALLAIWIRPFYFEVFMSFCFV